MSLPWWCVLSPSSQDHPSAARREAGWLSGCCPPPAGKAGGDRHPMKGGRLGPSLICSPGKPAPGPTLTGAQSWGLGWS